MAVKKRPAPKRLSRPEKLATLLGGRNLPIYDMQRLEWLKVIAAERGMLKPRMGLYEAAHDWLFDLAYALAVERYGGFGPGRRSATPREDIALIDQVRKMRMKHPNESQRVIAARVLGINPKLIDRKTHPANSKKVEALWKRYMAAEGRQAHPFTK